MGLDWIAITMKEDEESTEMFRGKGVACDINIKKLEDFNCEDTYGVLTDYEGGKCWIMTNQQRLSVMKAIKKVINKPVDEIDWEDSDFSYEEWRDFLIDAFHFVKENKTILCWF